MRSIQIRPIASHVHGLSVCPSVCLSVGHADVLWQNSWTDRDAVWHVGWGRRQSPCIRWESRSTHGKGQFWGISSPIEKHWDCMFPSVQRHVSLNRERCTLSVTHFPARMFHVHVKITYIITHLGVQKSFKVPFWWREQAFSGQTGAILKPTYYRNYCADCNQTLYSG